MVNTPRRPRHADRRWSACAALILVAVALVGCGDARAAGPSAGPRSGSVITPTQPPSGSAKPKIDYPGFIEVQDRLYDPINEAATQITDDLIGSPLGPFSVVYANMSPPQPWIAYEVRGLDPARYV